MLTEKTVRGDTGYVLLCDRKGCGRSLEGDRLTRGDHLLRLAVRWLGSRARNEGWRTDGKLHACAVCWVTGVFRGAPHSLITARFLTGEQAFTSAPEMKGGQSLTEVFKSAQSVRKQPRLPDGNLTELTEVTIEISKRAKQKLKTKFELGRKAFDGVDDV